jgi:hypothetical protein
LLIFSLSVLILLLNCFLFLTLGFIGSVALSLILLGLIYYIFFK